MRPMIWFKAFVLLVLDLVATCAAIRMFAKLPSLEGRTASRAFFDTDDTYIGRAIAASTAANPGLSGVHSLDEGHDAFAARVLLARAAARNPALQTGCGEAKSCAGPNHVSQSCAERRGVTLPATT